MKSKNVKEKKILEVSKYDDIKYIIILVCFYLLIFQNFIQSFIPLFRYFDEILAVSFIPVFIKEKLIDHKKINFTKNDLFISVFLIFILYLGSLSNVLFKYQSFKYVLIDIVAVFKFFLVYYLAKLTIDSKFITKYKDKFLLHVRIVIYVFFFATALNYLFKIWPDDYRLGIMSNKLFYGHPTYLAAVVVFLLSVLVLLNKNFKNHKIEIVMLFIVLLSTLRFKAIASVIILFFIILYILRFRKKLSLFKLILLGIIGLAIGWKQIYFYFITIDDSARSRITYSSVEIAKDYFPLGTGFGTFGSYVSGENYSPIYYDYNLYRIHGLKPDNHNFISDTFWPMILGQFGIFGFIMYSFCIICIFKNIQDEFKLRYISIYLSKIICFVYLLISSTSESAYVNPLAIPFAIILGISYNSHGLLRNKKPNLEG